MGNPRHKGLTTASLRRYSWILINERNYPGKGERVALIHYKNYETNPRRARGRGRMAAS
jgi:hypothetical protein